MVEVKTSIMIAVAIEDHNVRSRAASYQKLVREQILAILGVDNSRSSDQCYYRPSFLSACTYYTLLNIRKEVCAY